MVAGRAHQAKGGALFPLQNLVHRRHTGTGRSQGHVIGTGGNNCIQAKESAAILGQVPDPGYQSGLVDVG